MQEIKLSPVYKTKVNGKDYYRCDATIETSLKEIRKSFGSYKRYMVLEKREAWVEKYKDLDFINSNDFGSMFYNWIMNVKKDTVLSNTLEKYLTTYEKRLKGYPIAKKEIIDISNLDAQEFIKSLSTENSLSSIKESLVLFKSFFKYAIDNKMTKFNPFATIKIKVDKKPRKAYTIEEQREILNSLDYEDPVDLAIYTSLISGLRLGECLALKVEDFTGDSLNADKQYNLKCNLESKTNKTNKRIKEIRKQKTKSSKRVIPIPKQACQIIKDRIIAIKELNLKTGFKYDPDNILFCDKGTYIERKRPTRRLKKICEENNIEYKTFHALRHTYITRLAESNISPKIAQTLAGHKDFATTMNVYTHIEDNIKREAVKKLDELNVFTI
ncbi:tyrosine-type recombinase/integrase [Peptoniphilus catoniae]|uniref:tyrosine-type recombinase/integrase n=1 Tax=Peptoniphilus catoniae TaxID=1660341 RepID=UPI0010FEC47B|nr:site-specific integrase [Peptoniphilus catoniae]